MTTTSYADDSPRPDTPVKCPECPGRTFENMDAYMDHVSDIHDPLAHWREAARRVAPEDA